MEKKLDKRSKEYKDLQAIQNRSEGLGDTIEKITQATGIKTIVKAIFGDDCGCDERKEKLNKMFRYKTECLTEDEFYILDEILPRLTSKIEPIDQREILIIYNRVFNQNIKHSNCSTCWIRMIKDMRSLHEEYLKEINE